MSEGLPSGWAECHLRQCASVLDNLRVPVNSDERAKRTGDIPYYGATGQVGWIDDYLFDEELLLIGEDGAPFFDKSKPISYIITGKSWVNNHAHVLRSIPEITTNKYLKYYLDWFDFNGYVNGTTRLKLTQGALNRIPVYIAPRNEERRIVEKLEKLLDKVDLCQNRLAKIPILLKRFRQAVQAAACLGELTADWRNEENGASELPITWTQIKFSELIVGTPQNGLYKPQSEYGSGTLIVRIENLNDGRIDPLESLKRVRVSESEIATYSLLPNDILINRVNSMKFLGKSAQAKDLTEYCIFESNMMRLRLDTDRVQPEYAIIYLQSVLGLTELRKNAKHAVNQSSINQQDVRSTLFNLPPPPEQLEIVRRVGELFALADQVEARYANAKKYVDSLKQSILPKRSVVSLCRKIRTMNQLQSC